jgi:hypothetical protein
VKIISRPFRTRFTQNIFVYANVPYKIKGYADILQNQKTPLILIMS